MSRSRKWEKLMETNFELISLQSQHQQRNLRRHMSPKPKKEPEPTTTSTSADAAEEYQNEEDIKRKKLRSGFKQQKLKAWKPYISAGTAFPTLFVISLICIPLGIGIWVFSNNVKEIRIDYTNCASDAEPNKPCSQFMGKFGPDPGNICDCQVSFTVPYDLLGDVHMYYELTHFYQNNRRMVRSRDNKQLNGRTESREADCKPFWKDQSLKFYWPCGAKARSMFQDDIELFHEGKMVKLLRTGIAWPSDKQYRFKNPKDWETTEFKDKHVKPDAWINSPWDLDPSDPKNNGLQNEDFIVWMRTSAFPNFRKLYRRIEREGRYKDGLPKGDYQLRISYTFPVTSYGGTKSIILGTTSILGGKNKFLAFCCMGVGGCCFCMALLFFGIGFIDRRYKTPIRVGIAESESQSQSVAVAVAGTSTSPTTTSIVT